MLVSGMRAIGIVLIAVLASVAISPGQSGVKPVFLGVVRADDGRVIPIAIHDGHEWWNRWPFSFMSDDTIASLRVPGSLAEIPADWLPPRIVLPPTWRLQLEKGGSRLIHLGRPVRPQGFSLAAMIAIETDYPARKARPSETPDMELGVAVSGPAELGRFVPLSTSSTEFQLLMQAIVHDLNDAETKEIAYRIHERASEPNGQVVTFPATEAERARAPFLYAGAVRAARVEGGRIFYEFGALKDYGSKPYPDCEVTVNFAAIVVRERDGRIAPKSSSAYTTLDCTRDNGIGVAPRLLATVHWHGPTLWVVRFDAEDGFDYGLIDPALSDPMSVRLRGLWQLREPRR